MLLRSPTVPETFSQVSAKARGPVKDVSKNLFSTPRALLEVERAPERGLEARELEYLTLLE
jgi:hypothetical protein